MHATKVDGLASQNVIPASTPFVMAKRRARREATHAMRWSTVVSFAIRLRALREAAGMTQEQLALACGFSGQRRIANYEAKRGAREPSISDLLAIAAAISVPVGVLVDPVEYERFALGDSSLAKRAATISYLYLRADDAGRRMIEAVAEAANPEYKRAS